METATPSFTAVVLAADRTPPDPVAAAAGVSCKALAPVAGTPMVLRVLDALDAAREVGAVCLCGPPWSSVERNADLLRRIESGRVGWEESRATPSSSASRMLRSRADDAPVLVTTADHALLSARIVDHFCSEARASGCDLVVGLALHEGVAAAFPGTRRTVTRLRDGTYCGCNLFAFLTARARAAADFWLRVESQRKKPLRVVRALGWTAVARYLAGRLTLPEGLRRISLRLGVRVGAVVLPFPEAAVDVDTVEDWELVRSVAGGPDR